MINRIVVWLIALVFAIGTGASAQPPPQRLARLRHGVNITHWFRYPPSQAPAALRGYLDDPAIRGLVRAGFTFVRLPVQPEVLLSPGAPEALADSVARLERQGLAVVVVLHPSTWHLETNPADRAALTEAWRSLASALRRLDPNLTFPELLNEPVFPNDPTAWSILQHQLVQQVRSSLPSATLVLTGNDWGSIRGILRVTPEADRNVIYSFHLYDPAELTALAAYRPGLDRTALAQLPFPADIPGDCMKLARATADSATAGLIRFYCAQEWNAGKLAAQIAEAADWGRHNHFVILAGEFGASQQLNSRARLSWLAAVREACDQQGIGWALWGYDDSMGFALRPPGETAPIPTDVLRALGLVPMLTK